MMQRQGRKSIATRLRHRVAIQRVTLADDGEGNFDKSWATISTVWAAVDPLKAKQQLQYKSVGVEATHLITMRGLTDVDEADRLYYNSRVLEILTVENIQERDFVKVVTCKEVRD